MKSSGQSSPVFTPHVSGPSTPGTEAEALFDQFFLPDTCDDYVLVTGGLGFIGSHTVLELLKAEYNVVIVDDLSNSFADVFNRILTIADRHYAQVGGRRPKAVLHTKSYTDATFMEALFKSHTRTDHTRIEQRPTFLGVIHFAAFKAVEESINNPLMYYRNNISGLVDFMSLLERYNTKTFIFSSSASVYGTLADGSRPLREEQCVHEAETFVEADGTVASRQQGCVGLTSPYGRTKFFGEAILSDLSASDAAWKIVGLRYFNPIGCDPSGLLGEDPAGIPSNLLPVVVRVLTGQYKELSIYGNDWDTADGTTVRDFIHVTDLARGHIAALSAALKGRIREGYRTYNLGTGRGYSVLDVVSAMKAVSKLPIPTVMAGRRPGDVQSSVPTVDRARSELGWATQESLADACRDVWNHLNLSRAALQQASDESAFDGP